MNDPRLKSESRARAPIPLINIHLACHLMAPALLCPVATQASRRAIISTFCEKRVEMEGNCFKATATGYSNDISHPPTPGPPTLPSLPPCCQHSANTNWNYTE